MQDTERIIIVIIIFITVIIPSRCIKYTYIAMRMWLHKVGAQKVIGRDVFYTVACTASHAKHDTTP